MRSHGFTLLELLVALTIAMILAAIAIPRYQEYRGRAFDQRALSDLTAIALAEEAYFLDHEEYLSCENQSCTSLPGIAAISQGVEIAVSAAETAFTGLATHLKGSGRTFHWDSEQGGLLE